MCASSFFVSAENDTVFVLLYTAGFVAGLFLLYITMLQRDLLALLFEALVKLVGHGDRTVMPAGAAERHVQMPLAFLHVARDRAVDQAVQVLDEGLGDIIFVNVAPAVKR